MRTIIITSLFLLFVIPISLFAEDLWINDSVSHFQNADFSNCENTIVVEVMNGEVQLTHTLQSFNDIDTISTESYIPLKTPQEQAKIAMQPSGKFMVVWQSENDNYDIDIYARCFDEFAIPLGEEFRVNDDMTTYYQGSPDIAVDGIGNYIVVWSDEREATASAKIYFQRYDTNGNAIGGANSPASASIIPSYQISPSVAANTLGEFIIAWSDARTGDNDIYYQHFDNTGISVFADDSCAHNYYGTGTYENAPSVAFGNDTYVITYFSDDIGLYMPYFSLYATNDIPITIFNSVPFNDVTCPEGADVKYLPNGDKFLIVWSMNTPKIYGRRFSAIDGSMIDAAEIFLGNAYTSNEEIYPSLTIMDTLVIIAYQSTTTPTYIDYIGVTVWDTTFTDSTTFILDSPVIDSSMNSNPDVALNAMGDFCVVWQNADMIEIGDIEIYAQLYSTNPIIAPHTGSILLNNDFIQGDQRGIDIIAKPDGGFIATWIDTSLREIRAQIYDSTWTSVGEPLIVSDTLAMVVANYFDGYDDICLAPTIALNSTNGNWAVVWIDERATIKQPYIQCYDITGTAIGSNMPVLAGTAADAANVDAAADNNDNIIITWQEGISGETSIYMATLQLNSPTSTSQTPISAMGDISNPSISLKEDGEGIIVWEENDAINYNIKGCKINTLGPTTSDTLLISSAMPLDNPVVSMNNDGSYIIAYSNNVIAASYQTTAKLFTIDNVEQVTKDSVFYDYPPADMPLQLDIIQDMCGGVIIAAAHHSGVEKKILARSFYPNLIPTDFTIQVIGMETSSYEPSDIAITNNYNIDNLGFIIAYAMYDSINNYNCYAQGYEYIYPEYGYYQSTVFDASASGYAEIVFKSAYCKMLGDSLSFQFRTDEDAANIYNIPFTGPGGDTSTYFNFYEGIPDSVDINLNGKVIQYKAYFYSDTYNTPVLDSLAISFAEADTTISDKCLIITNLVINDYIGNNDGMADVGEKVELFISVMNNTDNDILGLHAELGAANTCNPADWNMYVYDPYFNAGTMNPDCMVDSIAHIPEPAVLVISSSCTVDTIEFPITFYNAVGTPICTDTLKLPIGTIDSTQPHLEYYDYTVSLDGDSLFFAAYIFEPGGFDHINLVLENPDGFPLGSYALNDGGTNGDIWAGDRMFSSTMPLPFDSSDYFVNLDIMDISGNGWIADNLIQFNNTPFHKENSILLVFETPDTLLYSNINYYKSALDANSYDYDIWLRYQWGTVPIDILNEYLNGIVILAYSGCYVFPDTDMQNNLIDFSNNGGKFFISSQDLGIAYNDSEVSTVFYNSILGADFIGDNSEIYNINGVANDPITDSLNILLLDSIAWSSDVIKEFDVADTNIVSIFSYNTTTTSAALRHEISANSRIVYFAFPYESIAEEYERKILMTNIIEWLKGYAPLGAPINLQASPSNEQVALSWNAPIADTIDLAGYNIYYEEVIAKHNKTKAKLIIDVGDTTNYIISGLTNGQNYSFYVVAYTLDGTEGIPSDTLIVMPNAIPPGAPTNFQAFASNQQIELFWNTPIADTIDLMGYNVYYEEVIIAKHNKIKEKLSIDVGDTTGYIITGLTNGQAYDVYVIGYNLVGIEGISTDTLRVIPTSEFYIQIFESDTTICINTPLTLHAYSFNAVGMMTFNWDFDDNGTIDATGDTVIANYTTAGNYTCILKGTDASAQVDSDTIYINVLDPVIASISFSANPIYIGDDVTISANVSGGDGDYTYLWLIDGIEQTNISSSFTTNFAIAGDKTITLNVDDQSGSDCAIATDTKILMVLSEEPEPPILNACYDRSEDQGCAIILSWTLSLDDNDISKTGIVDEYYIYRGITDTNLTLIDTVSAGISYYTDITILEDNISYYYALKSHNTIGSVSIYTNIMSAISRDDITPETLFAETPLDSISIAAMEYKLAGVDTAMTIYGLLEGTPSDSMYYLYNLNNTNWIQTTSSSIVIYPLADGTHNIEIASLDRGGNADTLSPLTHTLRVNTQSAFESKIVNNNWNMIAFPSQFNGELPSAIMNIEEYFLYHWNPQGAETSLGNRYQDVSNDGLIAGIGYWLKSEENPILSEVSGIASGTISIPLYTGWNQIGIPYAYPIDWTTVQIRYNNNTLDLNTAVNNELLQDAIYWYADNGYLWASSNTSPLLESWSGYWILAYQNCDLILSDTPQLNPSKSSPDLIPNTKSDDWIVQLSAYTSTSSDMYNFIGIQSDKEQFIIEPPVIIPYISLYLNTANDKKYASEIRNNQSDTEAWYFNIENESESSDIIHLTWQGVESVANDNYIYIFDCTSKEWYNMREQSQITYQDSKKRQFAIYLTSHPLADLPVAFELKQNYPNPFNPSTNIEYDLPLPDNGDFRITSDVNLKIYNMRGQLVRTLVDEMQPSGHYKLIWNGTDEYSNPLPSGVYFYKLEYNNYKQINKMLLLK